MSRKVKKADRNVLDQAKVYEKYKHLCLEDQKILREKALHFNLMSDVFMSVVLGYKGACQHVLRKILRLPSLVVDEVKSQYRVSHPTSRECVLDVLATDSAGKLYNVEIQRGDNIDHAKRVQYNASLLAVEFARKGTEFADLPEVKVIYITETDIWGLGQTVYLAKTQLVGFNTSCDDGREFIYVNAAVDDGSEIAALMRYFLVADPYDASEGELSKVVHDLKITEEGQKKMCKVMQEAYEMGAKRGKEIWFEEGLEQGEKRGMKQGMKQGIKQGVEQGEKKGVFKSQLNAMRKMIDSLKWSLEQAMEFLQIPVAERDSYRLAMAQG